MAQHGALGLPGGAGGVLDHRQIMDGRTRMRRVDRRCGHQFLPTHRAWRGLGEPVPGGAQRGDRELQREPLDQGECLQQVHRDDPLGPDVGGQLTQFRHRGVPGDHNPRRMVLEQVPQFARGVERVVLDHDRAQPQDGVERHHVLRAVGQDQRDAVTRLHAQPAQPLRRAGDLVAQGGVGRGPSEEVGGHRRTGLGDRPLAQRDQGLGRQFDLGGHPRLIVPGPGRFGVGVIAHASILPVQSQAVMKNRRFRSRPAAPASRGSHVDATAVPSSLRASPTVERSSPR